MGPPGLDFTAPHLNEDAHYDWKFYFPHSSCYKHDHKYIDCHMKQDFIESIPMLYANKYCDKELLIKNIVAIQKEAYQNSLKKNQVSTEKLKKLY